MNRIEEYKSPEDKAVEQMALNNIPVEYSHLNSLDIVEIFELMKEPSRAISTCISKGQLQTLCRKLLLDNLSKQKNISKLEKTLRDVVELCVDKNDDEAVKNAITFLLKKS